MKERSKISIVLNLILITGAIIIISKLWHTYKLNDFSEFTKAEYKQDTSEFTRDDNIKYTNAYSYKIFSNEYNDALIYKKIEVEKNTPYKVSAMVRYENVENEEESAEGGVNIGIMDTTEKSESYIGTGDWQKITFEFNSKERDNVDIAFRLGAYDSNCKGTAWFSDFKIEKGKMNSSSNWNCAFFIMKNINVNTYKDGLTLNTNLSMQNDEIGLLKENMERFKNSMKELSAGKMTVTYDVFEIEKPIDTISYTEEYGYYVSASNVRELINNYVEADEYDHIFVAYKLGEYLHEERIRTGDWIGLGGMTYGKDIGFSNIRVPNEKSTLVYKYTTYNKFPEEVFVHEFLHGLERIEGEYGREVIQLHSNQQYGYKENTEIGLRDWYSDYLQGNVTNLKLGLNSKVFTEKPVHESDFIETVDLTKENFNEPQNIKEELETFINELKKYLKKEESEKVEDTSGSLRV